MNIVPMQSEHLNAVVELESSLYSQPWSRGMFATDIALTKSRDCSVALSDGLVVGYSGLSYVHDEAHVTNVAVNPQYQRRGIASALMVHNMELCLGRGMKHATLEVRVSNVSAQGLYRKFGFAPAGIRRGYYSQPKEDALIMWAYDIHSAEYAQRMQRIANELRSFDVLQEVGA